MANGRLGRLAWGSWVLGGMLVAVGSVCSANEAGSRSRSAQFDELVSRYQQCGYLNGAVLVAQHGEVIYAKGVGAANMETGAANTPHTKFGIASLTKQFTAALVLQQVERGKLQLDGKLSEYLAWYRQDTGQRITVEQLLHHTSGLPPDYDNPAFSDSAEAMRHYEPQAFAEKFCQPDLQAPPGTKWAYSNSGYVLLGLILERVTGRPFADLLRDEILQPLGMNDTGMDNNDLPQHGGAIGYTRHAGPRYTPGPRLDRGHVFSAGAMYSTAEDLFRWNQALSSDQLFSRVTREQMFRPGMNDWAYGWFVTTISSGRPGAGATLAEMRGDLPGNYFSWILRYPEQDAVIIVLRNSYESTEHFEENLQAVLFGRLPHFPRRSVKDIAAHTALATFVPLVTHWRLVLCLLFLSAGLTWIATHRGRIFARAATRVPAFRS